MVNELYDEVLNAIDRVVDEYITDSELSKLNEILDEKLLDDPEYNKEDFVKDFYNICSHANIYFDDYIREELDNSVIYYSDCLEFIKRNNYYNGWKDIADEENGGEPFDSISQLVYCILLNDYYQNFGEDLLAEKVYDLITS